MEAPYISRKQDAAAHGKLQRSRCNGDRTGRLQLLMGLAGKSASPAVSALLTSDQVSKEYTRSVWITDKRRELCELLCGLLLCSNRC